MSGGMAWYLVWPGRAWRGIWYYLFHSHVQLLFTLGSNSKLRDSMAWRTWHGICYGLAGIWYGLVDNGMVYGITWQAMAWYMVWLAGKAWCMVWPDGHGI